MGLPVLVLRVQADLQDLQEQPVRRVQQDPLDLPARVEPRAHLDLVDQAEQQDLVDLPALQAQRAPVVLQGLVVRPDQVVLQAPRAVLVLLDLLGLRAARGLQVRAGQQE